MAEIPPKPAIRCPACSRPLVVGSGVPAARTCPDCGTRLDRLPTVAEVVPASERHVLVPATGGDEDGSYAVIGAKPHPPCPGCTKPLPEAVAICPACNYDRAAKRRVPRTYAPFDQTWEAGIALRYRLAAFAACQAVNVVVALFVAGTIDIPATIGGWLLVTAMQALLLGTYDRVRLRRTAKGKVTVEKTWRCAFIPFPPKLLDCHGCEGVEVRSADVGWLEWLMCLYLLCYGIIPGVLWYWYAIRPGRFSTIVTKDIGAAVHVLYAGTDSAKADEIGEAVGDLTGLPFNPYSS